MLADVRRMMHSFQVLTILILPMVLAAACSDPAAPARRILVHGHRGARALRPENTLPAFQYAIAQGVDVLELDMAVTRDNVIVISHDTHMNRAICQGPAGETAIHQLSLEQVWQWDCGALKNPNFPLQQPVPGTKMPTLDEVFDLAAPSAVELNIETKINPQTPELAPDPLTFSQLVVDAVRRHKMERRVMVQSFDFRTLKAVRTLAPEIRLSALYEGTPKSFLEIARDAGGVEIISPRYSLATPEQVLAAHAAGMQVMPWTANTPAIWERLVEAQVDAIISDDPAALIAWLKARQLR